MKKIKAFHWLPFFISIWLVTSVSAASLYEEFKNAMDSAVLSYNNAVEYLDNVEYRKAKDKASEALDKLKKADEVIGKLRNKMENVQVEKKEEARQFITDLENNLQDVRNKAVLVKVRADMYLRQIDRIQTQTPQAQYPDFPNQAIQSAPPGSSGKSRW